VNGSHSTLLETRPERLWPFVVGAAVGHVAVIGGMLALSFLMSLLSPPPAPLISPDESMEVAVVSMAKSQGLPTLAMHAPRASGTSTPSDVPPPVQQSDLAFKDPNNPEPKPMGTPDDDTRRQELMDEMRRQDLLGSLDGPEGPEDRQATSPDGADGGSGTALGRNDPYAAALRKAYDPVFQPLPALRGKGLVTKVFIRADASGRVLETKLKQTSGNASWDRAALAAAEVLTDIPAPPPERVAAVASGFVLAFGDN
jgi:outer membrane biosynthesis protein TonB